MLAFKRTVNVTGIVVLLSTFFVFFMSAERTGSLWDCGEFILGAYKLQVVHPPGAGLFVLIGRMFTIVADLLSDNPSDIAFAVNLMSGLCTALAAMFIAWVTMIFGRLALVGKEGETNNAQNIALAFAGLVAGLSTAFSTSIWFSAVEGEVYAMSTFFTTLTLWAAVKWYALPDDNQHDRWLLFSIFSAGLSTGVHLLSLLAFPAIAMLYYFKKYKNITWLGMAASAAAGLIAVGIVQKLVIVGIPILWKNMELLMVNGLGLPFHTGLIPAIAILGAIVYYVLRFANQKSSHIIQMVGMAIALLIISYSSIGVVVIRANADTPINMNVPSDAMRLIPYLNREQYGERPLLYGPHYMATPIGVDKKDRYGRVGRKYEFVDEKYDYKWKSSDKILFPRIGHQDREDLHNIYREYLTGETKGKPGMRYNLAFFWNYQLNWMYWRYFMWNFAGRQNGEQGVFSWDPKDGNWLSGIDFIDSNRLYNQAELTDAMEKDQARNKYYLLPLLFGIIGLVFHFMRRKNDFLALVMLFLLTGIGIIIFSNQPPQEPRERDYVLVGSFMTFCIWIGFGVLGIYHLLFEKLNSVPKLPLAGLAGIVVLTAPIIMVFQNFDDHSRRHHTAARDYAANFLNSVDENAIIFTYGDNDTYPLWYAQEVENIRRDVRVVNLSLIAVDWYINKLRSKINDSPPIKLTIPEESYRGKRLNQVYFLEDERNAGKMISTLDALRFIADPKNHRQGVGVLPSRNLVIPIDKFRLEVFGDLKVDSSELVDLLPIKFSEKQAYFTKDDLAIIDLITSNINDRPIYFAVTCKNDKLLGLNDYMQLEGLALRLIPVKSRSERGFGIYGSGRVNEDKFYDNVMTKWKWGNFDKKELYVDKSYMAQVQSMKFTILRTAMSMLTSGDRERSIALVNKYFDAFPNFNFPYDVGIVPFLNLLTRAEAYEDLMKHTRILANECAHQMRFYKSLNDRELSHFSKEAGYTQQAIDEIFNIVKEVKNSEFEAEMKELLGQYRKDAPKMDDVPDQLEQELQ